MFTVYSTAELRAMPVLSDGWTANLYVHTGKVKYWLERGDKESGHAYDNTVTVEYYDGNSWIFVIEYDGDNPPDSFGTFYAVEWETDDINVDLPSVAEVPNQIYFSPRDVADYLREHYGWSVTSLKELS